MKLIQLHEARYAKEPGYKAWLKDPSNAKGLRALRLDVISDYRDMSERDKAWARDQGEDLSEYNSWTFFPGYGEDERITRWVQGLTMRLINKQLAL